MKTIQTTAKRDNSRLVRVSLQKNVTLRKQYVATIPTWRRPLIGYIASIPITAIGLLCTFILKQMLGYIYFPGAFSFLTLTIIAFIWGTGPSLFAIVLCMLALDYFFIPPIGLFVFHDVVGSLQLIPFFLTGLIISLITAQRERARLLSLAAEQDLQSYADELEATNTQLEAANRQLKDADQLKDRFLSIASHELKTPITSIRGQAQLALRRLSKQKMKTQELEGMHSTLEKINEQTTRLTTLVDELLDVSSIRSGKIQLHKRECELVDLCRGIVEDQHLLSERPISLETDTPVLLVADCERLAQVIVNLVSNAIKYSPERSPIEVRVSKRDTNALIEVQDHGKGITKEQQEHIFDTFYRTPDAQASSKFGLGLGLSICKDIVERHGGRIWCESELGKGSRFFVELPLQ
jgi:signal transduction histidine kinase